MNTDQIVRRARSAIGGGCIYHLGKGGRKPVGNRPWDSKKRCDCSGFTSWVLKLDRKTDHPFYMNYNDGWINTDAMWLDGVEPVGFFRRLPSPQIGALLIYPGSGSARGHVGVISELNLDGSVKSVIHCSKGNDRKLGDAIGETKPAVFARHPKSIVIWYEGATSLADEVRRTDNKYG